MEKHNNSENNIEKIILKDDGSSSVISDADEDPSLRPLVTCREKLCKLFESHKFQIGVIALVLIDCIIVVAELILEAKHHELDDKTIPHVLHYLSIVILSVFIVEIVMKMFAFRAEFFRHKLEVFDAFVVFLSFALDISFWEQEEINLIIVLRLWRVARILNGVLISVKTQSEHKLHKERQLREGVEQELNKCRLYTNALEKEVEMLRSLLEQHNIKMPPSVMNKSQPQNTINVVAEVNQIPAV
ncbi:voltage-gated hydrogen channel 1-like [Argiope bruennichi]|uniref:voltage-gated hydrogen channel 1-like n=1 Tax=Argiope bruennichi TaxID=94029 RepID=UPI002493E438|nr:voltage-gated hydrogen channel 1-like [Argiope bruennichi]XP_055950319.1 voltage-gated hydrogen channel 1-like [Argiope bruennichi]